MAGLKDVGIVSCEGSPWLVGGGKGEGRIGQGCKFSRVLVIIHGKEVVQTLCPRPMDWWGLVLSEEVCGSPAEKEGARVYKGRIGRFRSQTVGVFS